MNTQTGNIFALDGNPLAENEVELTREQFAALFPVRDLKERLKMYQEMKSAELNAPEAGSGDNKAAI